MRKQTTCTTLLLTLSLLTGAFATTGLAASSKALAKGFAAPPASARPWVYWFWLDGNITREGITADLEAMQRVGIGGVLIMEVDQGAPKGPARFGSPQWRELFKFMLAEARRLGLEVNMNNDAGWCGSGGPWITPELSMQKVVWTTTQLEGPRRFEGKLPEPEKVAGYYEDIVVLASPTPAEYRIERIQAKAGFIMQELPYEPLPKPLPAEKTVARSSIRDITPQMDKSGRLVWDVPPGKWSVVRFGHTSTGAKNAPSPADAQGLECDKLSRKGADAMFDGLMGKLIADSPRLAGKTLVSTHIDSWEVGSQNWTAAFPEEFRRLRGYDPLPFLPVMMGQVVESLEVSERFLWDVRQTVSELLVENYAGQFRKRAHEHGLRLSIEAYGEPANDLTYAGQADEPMGEFWSWSFGGAAEFCTEMVSAAHVYGRPIVGAEAFTATDKEKWLGHPGNIKALGDWAFCEGINRFVFHRYAMQPWRDVKPGMSMGPWGLHYERTETWWEQSKGWHEYLARCQYLLQQGQFVADVCFLEPEASPHVFRPPYTAGRPAHRPGYNFDGCPPALLLSGMKVKDGRLVLPSGMSYRVLVLPEVEAMTPKLLRTVGELVKAGATVVGPAPVRSPSLANYPACDAEVQKLTRELWGVGAGGGGASVKQGWVIWPIEEKKEKAAPEAVPRLGSAKWIWFKEGNPAAAAPPGKRYFRRVVSVDGGAAIASARMVMTADNEFELWVNGTRAGAGEDFTHTHVMNCAKLLKPGTNLLAVEAVNGADFPNPAGLIGNLIIKYRDGRVVMVPTDSKWEAAITEPGNWRSEAGAAVAWEPALELGPPGMAPWGEMDHPAGLLRPVYPSMDAIAGVMKRLGVPPDFDYVTQSGEQSLRYIHKRIGDTDLYFVANEKGQPEVAMCSFRVGGRRPELWCPDSGKVERPVVYDEVDGCVRMPIHLDASGSVFVVFRAGEGMGRDRITAVAAQGEILEDARSKWLTAPGSVAAGISLIRGKDGAVEAEVRDRGTYTLTSADGGVRTLQANASPVRTEITGPWEVQFAPGGGAPERVILDHLISWSQHTDPRVRYFSGTATYRKPFEVRKNDLGGGRRLYLDLGKVEVMAGVRVNAKDLGTLWKEPYGVEVTDVLKPGHNELEVQVVNLWINRQIGDEQLPEDSERNPVGTLKQWPQWLQDGKPSPTGRYTFTSWKLWQKDSPLAESGLLGPVTLRSTQRVVLAPK